MKILIPSAVLAAALLACLVTWLFPEYGDSYSERQRELWNRRQTIFDPYEDTSRPESAARSSAREAAGKESAFLQQDEAPPWSLDLHTGPSSHPQAAGGRSFLELQRAALEDHDADACLILAMRKKFSPYQTYFFRRRWLEKAVELGRPGAAFLLSAAERRYLEKGPASISYSLDQTLCPNDAGLAYIMRLPGYDEFARLVLQGDFLAYKVLLAIEPTAGDSSLSMELDATMKRQAEQGDANAQCIAGEHGLYFLIENSYYRGKIWDEAFGSLPAPHPFRQWLNEWLHVPTGTRPRYETLSLRTEYAKWLLEAARQGNVQAMFLWLQFGVPCMDFMDRRSWEDVFRFADLLLKERHLGFIRELACDERYHEYGGTAILRSYYRHDDLERIKTQCIALLKEHDVILYSVYHGFHCDRDTALRDFNADLLARIELEDPSLLYLYDDDNDDDDNAIPLLEQIYRYDRILFQQAISTVRQAAETGDLHALLALGYVYMNPEFKEYYNPRLALDTLEQVLSAILTLPVPERYRQPLLYSMLPQLEDALMSLCLDNSSPLYNPGRAFAIARDLYDATYRKANGHNESKTIAILYLGQMYQKGYGTPVDHDKALDYYREAVKPWNEKRVLELMERRNLEPPVHP